MPDMNQPVSLHRQSPVIHPRQASRAATGALCGALLLLATLLPNVGFAQTPADPPAQAATPAQTAAPDRSPIVRNYDAAVAYLEKICEDYRRIKAIQLGQQRNISVADAYANIDSVMPVLDPIDRDLLGRPIYDPAEIESQKREIEAVEMQIDMMIELAAKLLEEIEKVKIEIVQFQPEFREVTLEEILQKEQFDPEAVQENTPERYTSEELQALAELAQQKETAEAVDLTQVMRPLLPNIEDLTEEDTGGEPIRQDLMVSQSADNAPDVLNNIVNIEGLNKAMGRKIKYGGEPVEWLFIDSWYTVGPFPNPSRANLNRQFPPESIIDLDATYPGKDGQQVRWEFIQAPKMPVVPANDESYAIYYAYTEIFVDQPMDLWVALGCDDKAHVWLNDLPIYTSGDELKGWKPNEAFRKVSFQPGINRLLFRVENGWMGTAFSFAIRVAE